MDYRLIYEKRFRGPLAYVILHNFPSEDRTKVKDWVVLQRFHKAFNSDNYELLSVNGYRKGLIETENALTIEIDYNLFQITKKKKEQQKERLFN